VVKRPAFARTVPPGGAVEVLKTEGLVRSEHGRGVFARQRPTIRRLARNRFGRAYRETGKGA
jgi:GntR family transcriptional regulator